MQLSHLQNRLFSIRTAVAFPLGTTSELAYF